MERDDIVKIAEEGIRETEGVANQDARGRFPLGAVADRTGRRRIGGAFPEVPRRKERFSSGKLLGGLMLGKKLLDAVHVPLRGYGQHEDGRRPEGDEKNGFSEGAVCLHGHTYPVLPIRQLMFRTLSGEQLP